MTTHIGTEVTFDCISLIYPEWYHNGNDIQGIEYVSMRNTAIVINSIRLHHSGVYECLGMYEDGETYFLAKALLRVIGK